MPCVIFQIKLGQTGNMITSFVTMLWLEWAHGSNVFMEKTTKHALSQIFVGKIGEMKTLEDSLCDYTQFGFEQVNIDLNSLQSDEYRIGRALALHVDIEKPLKGWWKFYRLYRKETIETLKFKPEIVRHVNITIGNIIKKVCLSR